MSGAALLMLIHPSLVRAETRALLVGVWQFDNPLIPDLKGPQNDLPAMEALVRGQGATDVTVLRNDIVSRTTVETALHALGLRSKPGDWILLYYSGHGAQADAAVKGTQDGDLDQFLPLAGFSLDQQDPERFIVDKDFYAWIARYIPRTVQVLMIADACHSGTMHRSVDQRAFGFAPRVALQGTSSGVQLTARPAPRFPGVLAAQEEAGPNATAREDLPNLIYVGAALDDQLALEASLPVEGAPTRGLLTYALEQGLTTLGADGRTLAADANQDGDVSIGEIAVYLNSQVRALTGQRQESTAFYDSGKQNLGVFAHVDVPAVTPPPPPDVLAVHATDAKTMALLGGEPGWRVVPGAAAADFLWDQPKGNVLRRSGDIVAQKVGTLAAFRGVVEKWKMVEKLRPLLSESSARMMIGPDRNGARYPVGSEVRLTLRQEQGPSTAARYATIFNLASDGTVQMLYPVAGDGDGLLAPGTNPPEIDNEVIAPFGTDHVVAILTPERPVKLRSALRGANNQRAAGRLIEPVRDAMSTAGGRGALSVAELYTGE